MILNETHIKMYEDCIFLNEGLFGEKLYGDEYSKIYKQLIDVSKAFLGKMDKTNLNGGRYMYDNKNVVKKIKEYESGKFNKTKGTIPELRVYFLSRNYSKDVVEKQNSQLSKVIPAGFMQNDRKDFMKKSCKYYYLNNKYKDIIVEYHYDIDPNFNGSWTAQLYFVVKHLSNKIKAGIN